MTTKGLRIPAATYRLQLNGQFGFSDAREITGYLHDMGISDLYLSPCFKARAGSMHGYDILDQGVLNPEIGTEETFDLLVEELRRHDMGQILDIVPNHMCIEGQGNAFWMDVLENGPSSCYALFFDIDWHPVKKELENKILIPVLGDQYGKILENGELRIVIEEGAFYLYYYEHKFPIIPKTYVNILTHAIETLEEELSVDTPQFQELMSIVTALKHLPSITEQDPERVAERYREKEVVKRRLWSLYQNSSVIRGFIDANLVSFNGVIGNPRSFDLLDDLVREQVFRISHWRVATEEINYRRFFDINSLGAIRVEDQAVFEYTHSLIFRMVREGKISGLRIDHADGLLDPEEYLKRLQYGCFLQLYGQKSEVEEDLAQQQEDNIRERYEIVLASNPGYKPFFIIGEKILLKSEKLPETWPVFGTTGYDFANQVNGLFVESANAKTFETIYNRFVRHRIDLPDVIYQKKKLVMQASMSSEINTLGHYLNIVSEQNRHTRDFTLNSLIHAIVEVIACFPVYRTYTTGFHVAERDVQYVESAVARARRLNPAMSSSVFDFIRDLLLLRFSETTLEEHKAAWLDFVKRFQQIAGPIMAKGVEDTTFYVYNRLVSLNEVGGSPERFGMSLEAFHGQNMERYKSRPLAMLATSTHDTKRSEDVRARINVLSEIPELWREGLARWSRMNRKIKMTVNNKPSPSRNEEFLLYQTLVGAWPFGGPDNPEFDRFRGRIKEYMLKAMREAKVHTSWINPESLHEDAALYFIDTILTPSAHNSFVDDFNRFQKLTAWCGMFNSLSQTLLKITSPGIPDFYQGTELWDLSLVDPDNRRPVDFSLRKGMLAVLQSLEAEKGLLETVRELTSTLEDGRIKQFVTWKALNLRKNRRGLFESGRYLPLKVEGSRKEHVCAFERSDNDDSVLVLAPRFFNRLTASGTMLPLGAEVWQNTWVMQPFDSATSRYRNIFTGEQFELELLDGQPGLALGKVFAAFPVALLERVA